MSNPSPDAAVMLCLRHSVAGPFEPRVVTLDHSQLKKLSLAVLLAAAMGGCAMVPQSQPVATPAQGAAVAARARLMLSEGGQLVLRAIDAHGSLDTWYNTPTSAFAWEYSNPGMGLRFKSYQVADNHTRHIYHRLVSLGSPDSPNPATGRFAWDGTSAWIHPAAIEAINPRFWATTPYYFQLIPFVLADPGLRYEKLPPEDLDGTSCDMVRVGFEGGIGDSPGDSYTLYVDKESGLVRAIRYTVTFFSQQPPSDIPPTRETLFYYDDYITVDGLTTPTRFRGFLFQDGHKGEFKNEAWASEISFHEIFSDTQTLAPAGARLQSPPAARPTTKE